MAYTGLTIETRVHDDDSSSHCIPAYPEYTSKTVFNAAYYALRQDSNDELAGATIALSAPD